MSRYYLDELGCIRMDMGGSVQLLPPQNNGTEEWGEYQRWLDDGNTPDPWQPPVSDAPAASSAEERLAALGLTRDDLRALLADG
jgi:hypothetical protein